VTADTSRSKKRKREKTITVRPMFREGDLLRAVRALKTAGLSIGQVVVANGDHTITLSTQPPAKTTGRMTGYLTMRDACDYGKFGRSQAYNWIRQGALQIKKLGNKTLVSKASIDRLLADLPRVVRKKRR
jgi:helix-turn-helix protein